MIDEHTKAILELSDDPVALVQTMHFATQEEVMEAAKYAIDLQIEKEMRKRRKREEEESRRQDDDDTITPMVVASLPSDPSPSKADDGFSGGGGDSGGAGATADYGGGSDVGGGDAGGGGE